MVSSRMILGMASILLSLGMVSSVMSLSNAEGMEEAICKASQSYTSSCRQNRRGSSDLPRMASGICTREDLGTCGHARLPEKDVVTGREETHKWPVKEAHDFSRQIRAHTCIPASNVTSK